MSSPCVVHRERASTSLKPLNVFKMGHKTTGGRAAADGGLFYPVMISNAPLGPGVGGCGLVYKTRRLG